MGSEIEPGFYVTAILVTHDGSTWLPETISALFQQTRSFDRIIAVDTSSTDNSPSMVRNAKIDVIEADRGEGFGDAIEIALRHLPAIEELDPREEVLWILHDDVAPSRDCLELLVAELGRNPLIAATGPKLRGWKDNTHLLEVGVSIAENGARWTSVERHERDQGQHDGTQEVLAVSTAAMLTRRSIFEDLGGFDSNLALFRDDVDFGWRARSAGYTITCMADAWALHAEAGANEIRRIDVDEAFLHRPLLLDRRNAAYVLFVNSSVWILPWVLIQLVTSSLFRASIDLLAKLPGYAGDELAALGLLLAHPRMIIKARRARKKTRLLSSRVVRPYIPPRSEQLRLGFERFTGVISEAFNRGEHEHYESNIGSSRFDESTALTPSGELRNSNDFEQDSGFSSLGLAEETFEEYEESFEQAVGKEVKSIRSIVRSWPVFWGIIGVLLFSTLLTRNRFGDISGGALAHSPSSSFDLIRKYFESWHRVGMGSALSTPPWVMGVGTLSFVTLSSPSIFIGNLFWLAPLVSFFVMYRILKRKSILPWISVLASAIYAISPTMISALNQGRIGTVFLAIIAPPFIAMAPITSALTQRSWRRIYGVAIYAAFLAFFSPLFLGLWSLILAGMFYIQFRAENKIHAKGTPLFNRIAEYPTSKRIFALAVVPWLLTQPWSLELLLHPTQFLLSPGFPLPGAGPLSILFFNPGGQASLPLIAISPFIFLYISLSLRSEYRRTFLIVSALLAVAIAASPVTIVGHGSAGNIWTGDLLLVAQVFILLELAPRASELFFNLRNSSFNIGHLTSALFAVVTLYSIISTAILSIPTAGNAPVQSSRSSVNPAFLTSLSQVASRPKLLAIESHKGSYLYYVSRGQDLELGDPDVITGEPATLDKAVFDLINGVGVNSGKTIGSFGISYIFVKAPIDTNLVRVIDGNGSFVRSSITNSGVIWKVVGASPRVALTGNFKTPIPIPSEDVSAAGNISQPGTVNLAENFDSHWQAILNGKEIPVKKNANGLPSYVVTSEMLNNKGLNQITILHTSQIRRIALSLQVLAFLVVFILALPAGRKKGSIS